MEVGLVPPEGHLLLKQQFFKEKQRVTRWEQVRTGETQLLYFPGDGMFEFKQINVWMINIKI